MAWQVVMAFFEDLGYASAMSDVFTTDSEQRIGDMPPGKESGAMEGVLLFTGSVAVLVGLGALVESKRRWLGLAMTGRKRDDPAALSRKQVDPKIGRVSTRTSA